MDIPYFPPDSDMPLKEYNEILESFNADNRFAGQTYTGTPKSEPVSFLEQQWEVTIRQDLVPDGTIHYFTDQIIAGMAASPVDDLDWVVPVEVAEAANQAAAQFSQDMTEAIAEGPDKAREVLAAQNRKINDAIFDALSDPNNKRAREAAELVSQYTREKIYGPVRPDHVVQAKKEP